MTARRRRPCTPPAGAAPPRPRPTGGRRGRATRTDRRRARWRCRARSPRRTGWPSRGDPSPTTGMRRTIRRSTTGCRARASSRMPVPSTEATRPKAMAQRNIAPVGWLKWGSPGMDREKLPNPVSESRPMKMRVPIPAANRPGTRTRPRTGPPSPDASINKKAPTMGEPSRALMAAKLPAEAITRAAVGGASFLARCTARAPSPPMAISGASGPRTTPRARVASAARNTPEARRRWVPLPP